MSYQALYRKYRPADFDDVVGQDAVINTLKNALKLKKTSHAYMFFGPRGTGKTTIAKILAKSLNCLEYDGHCCGKCKNCLAIASNSTSDIIEIDAASNNGVDEIREIRNKINLVPSELKYKVYIIDEVHMLSIGAFNALLKTLEEPPSHVVFILATTDPHKVPVTIVSRCQCFEFKRIPDNIITNRLLEVCDKENIEIDKEVLDKIAHLSDGGMRDSLGMLDRISSYSNEKITMSKFNDVNNFVDDNFKNQFLNNINNNNIVEILNQIEYMHSSGKDIVIFCQDLMEYLRDDMINYYLNGTSSFEINFSIALIEFFNKLLVDLKLSSNLKIMFETSLLSYIFKVDCNISKNNVVEKKSTIDDDIKEKDEKVVVDKVEKKINSVNQENNDIAFDYNNIKSVIINNTFATAQKKYLLDVKNLWNSFNEYVFDTYYGAIASFMLDTTVRAVGDDNMIITYNFDSGIDQGINNLNKMLSLLEKILGKSYNVAILYNKEWETEKNNYINSKSSGKEYILIPLEKEKNKNMDVNKKINEKDDIIEDDIVSQAINLFGEDIVKIDN